ncbi:MAG TPA: hypothetical protein VG433_00195, partial [Pirellulales bacterium]|nr:hypothetical protein [Pirellulales bacterium]
MSDESSEPHAGSSPPGPVPSTTPAEHAPTSESAAPPAAGQQPSGGPSRRVRIGSQRPDAPKPKSRPQSGNGGQAVGEQAIGGQAVGGQARPQKTSPVPNLRAGLPPEWEEEVEAAFENMSLEDALEPSSATAP